MKLVDSSMYRKHSECLRRNCETHMNEFPFCFSCNFREDTIPAPCMEQIIESTNKVSLDECADACSSVEECAFYVFDPFEDGDDDCTLFKRCLHMHVGDGIDGRQ